MGTCETSLRFINERSRKTDTRYSTEYSKFLRDGVTDEFIKPIVCVNDKNEPVATIRNGDAVICFNFRTDKVEITTVLTQEDKSEFEMNTLDLHYTTMTMYDKNFKNVNVIFEKDNLNNTLGQVIAENGLKKYVLPKQKNTRTYFFSGVEAEFEGEKRLMQTLRKSLLIYNPR